jgi:tripartite-type tricarboxylate transporter receptor subunit TctC
MRNTTLVSCAARALAALAIMTAAAGSALAQWQPTKPIRFYLPFAPGGAAEAILRTVTDPLKDRLKQPIVIEAKPGGGQLIAADAVAKSAPDGYTVLWASSTLIVSPILTASPFDVLKELQPVIHIGETPIMLAIHTDIPARNMAEFVRYLKANPGKVSYGFAGNGSSMHMAGELIKARAGVDMTAVPYKGSSQLLPDLLAGRVPAAVDAITTLKPHVDAGKLRILAIMNSQRVPSVPDVPTMIEAGYDNFAIGPWNGFFVPAGTPRDIVNTLARETDAVLRTPAIAETLSRTAGALVRGGTPEQFTAMLRQDIAQTTRIIQTAGIKAE